MTNVSLVSKRRNWEMPQGAHDFMISIILDDAIPSFKLPSMERFGLGSAWLKSTPFVLVGTVFGIELT